MDTLGAIEAGNRIHVIGTSGETVSAPVYTSDWAARQTEAYGALRRKEIAVKALCWLILAPALPLVIGHWIAEWIAERDAPRWCIWLGDKAEAFAEKHDVRI